MKRISDAQGFDYFRFNVDSGLEDLKLDSWNVEKVYGVRVFVTIGDNHGADHEVHTTTRGSRGTSSVCAHSGDEIHSRVYQGGMKMWLDSIA